MKYYISEKTSKAIKNGIPMCDVYMPRRPAETRTVAINIDHIRECFSCAREFVEQPHNDLDEGYFCDGCLERPEDLKP